MEAKILILAFLWFVRIIRLKCVWGWYNRRMEDNNARREPFIFCTVRQKVTTADCYAFYLGVLMLIKFLLSPGPDLEQIYFGFAVYLVGFIVTSLGRVHLGFSWADMFYVNQNNCPLVKNGLYASMRNPIYTGRYITCIGFGLTLGALNFDLLKAEFDSLFSMVEVLVVLLTVPIYLWLLITHSQEIKGEESYLTKKYGDEYLLYIMTTNRYLPKISKLIHFSPPKPKRGIKYAH